MPGYLIVAGFIAAFALTAVVLGIARIVSTVRQRKTSISEDQRRRRYATAERMRQEHYNPEFGDRRR